MFEKKKKEKKEKEGRISRDISSNRRIYHRTATSRACFFGTDNSLRNCRPLNRPFPPVSPRRWTHKEGGLSYPKKEKAARRRADRKRNSRNPRRITTRRRILPARQIKIRSNGRTRKNKRTRERERRCSSQRRGITGRCSSMLLVDEGEADNKSSKSHCTLHTRNRVSD